MIGVLHVDLDALVDAVVLQRADHLEAGAVADVGEARVAVAAEVALQDAAVLRAVEDRAPGLELAHAVGRLLGVQLGHAPVVEVLAAAHRVGEVDLPVVAVVDVGQRRGHAALGHDGVRLAEQRLADEADRRARRRRLDGGAQPGAAGADDEDVVLVGLDVRRRPSDDPQVVNDAHRAEADVDVGEADAEQAEPRPLHVVAVEAAHAVVGLLARRRRATACRARRRPGGGTSGSRTCSRRAARR